MPERGYSSAPLIEHTRVVDRETEILAPLAKTRRCAPELSGARTAASMPDTRIGAGLLEAARAFRPRIIADRDRIEAARRIPEDLAQELARAGFFRLLLPEAYGGLDLTPMAAMEVFEELAGA